MLFSTRWLLGAACCFIAMVAYLLPAGAQNMLRPVPLSTLIDHDTQMLTFVCGGPLTAEEKHRFAAVITQQVRQNANFWYKTDAQVSQDLQEARNHPGTVRAEIWLKWRIAFAGDNVEGTRIAAAHDPVLVVDKERQLLITEQTLRSLREAANWVAQQTGRPKPDAQYIEKLRNTIMQQWRTWPKETLAALTGAVKDFPGTVAYTMGDLPEAQRKEVFTQWANDGGAEPQRTLHMAVMMANYYNLAVQALVHRTVIQNANRMARPSSCDMIYGSGPYSTGTGAFCSPWEVNRGK